MSIAPIANWLNVNHKFAMIEKQIENEYERQMLFYIGLHDYALPSSVENE